jgi:tetratricopeptide (TPR) repeat protein
MPINQEVHWVSRAKAAASLPVPETVELPVSSGVAASLYGITALIIGGALAKGGYFPDTQLIGMMVLAGLFLVFQISRRNSSRRDSAPWKWSVLDYATIGFVVAYLISLPLAVDPREALQGALKQVSYFLIYFAVSRGAASAAMRLRLVQVLAAGAVLIALTAFLFVSKILTMTGTFDGWRLYSSFQYPNALAGFLLAGISLVIAARSLAVTRWSKLFWTVSLYTCLLAFIFTYSRGAWLVFPLLLAGVLIFRPSGTRIDLLFTLAPAFIGAVPATLLMVPALKIQATAEIWKAFAVGAGMAILADLLFDWLSQGAKGLHPRGRRLGLGLTAGLILAVVLTGLIAAILTGAMTDILAGVTDILAGGTDILTKVPFETPQEIVQRLGTINLTDYSAFTRIGFYIDGLQIVRDYPIVGTGEGGWAILYRGYQSWGYVSKLAHSSLLQTWIEAGILGLFSSLALVVGAVWALRGVRSSQEEGVGAAHALRGVRSSQEEGILGAGLVAGALALWAHSLIDFNLSLTAISAYLWAVLGLMRSQQGRLSPSIWPKSQQSSAKYRAARSLIWISPIILGLASASLFQGFLLGQAGAKTLNVGDLRGAAALFEKSLRYDPLASASWMDLGQARLSMGLQNGDNETTDQAMRALYRGLALNPFNSLYHQLLGVASLQIGRHPEGINHLERSVELDPFDPIRYEVLAQGYLFLGQTGARAGSFDSASEFYSKAVEVSSRMKQRARAIPAHVSPSLSMPETTAVVQLTAGRAASYLGQWEKAEEFLRAAADRPELKVDALLWLAAGLEKRERSGEAEVWLREAETISPEARGKYDATRALLLNESVE